MSVTGSKTPALSIPALYPRGKPRTLGPVETFSISAIAPALAVIFTNPFDTAKVRLQLQGERLKRIQKAGTAAVQNEGQVVYKNSFDTIHKIYVNEGLRGLQKGLTPAILREASKNFFRIGMYDPVMALLHDPSKGSAPPWKRMVAGAMCGMMGAVSCNPFELVKTRLQSAAAGKIAVGHQHNYTGVVDGLASIYRSDGIKGLYRGALLSMGRSIAGSGSNLAAYSMMKEYLITERKWPDNAWLDMVAGMASGIVSCLAMNPIDVVRTRYYNQPYENGKGVLYSGAGDAITKIIKNEGLTAFYKGITTHFLRIGPHFCLTFVFLGILRRGLVDFYGYLDRRESFEVFDIDHNGVLDPEEIRKVLTDVIKDRNVGAIIGTPGVPGEDELISAYMTRILEKADVNHDLKINFDEYKDVVKELGAIVGERRAAAEKAGKA